MEITVDGPTSGAQVEALAIVGDHDELVAALTARRKRLGISQLMLDEMTGLPSGYTGKVEAKDRTADNARSIGKMSLPLLLEALGVRLAVVSAVKLDPKQAAENAIALRAFYAERGRKGAAARNAKLSRAERQRIARQAGRARWGKARSD